MVESIRFEPSDEDAGTVARARRDEVESLIEFGVQPEVIAVQSRELSAFDYYLGELDADRVMGEITRHGRPLRAMSEREVAIFEHFYPDVNLAGILQEAK